MLELKNIYKIFNKGTVNESTLFNDFNFSVKKGEFVSVIGSNGSGKTTLLNLVCGTILPDSGKIIISGEDVTKKTDFYRYRKIGRVYQNPAFGTCANMTVLENMSLADSKNSGFGLSFLNRGKKQCEKYRLMLSELNLGLEDKMHVKAGNLSGGQRQAMSLLMSSMADIDFLILDEHTAALDPKTSEIIMKLTDKIVSENNITALMVTHNLRYAVEYGTRLVMMHEGKSVIDICGEEKKNKKVEDLLDVFAKISVELGN